MIQARCSRLVLPGSTWIRLSQIVKIHFLKRRWIFLLNAIAVLAVPNSFFVPFVPAVSAFCGTVIPRQLLSRNCYTHSAKWVAAKLLPPCNSLALPREHTDSIKFILMI